MTVANVHPTGAAAIEWQHAKDSLDRARKLWAFQDACWREINAIVADIDHIIVEKEQPHDHLSPAD